MQAGTLLGINQLHVVGEIKQDAIPLHSGTDRRFTENEKLREAEHLRIIIERDRMSAVARTGTALLNFIEACSPRSNAKVSDG